MPRDLRVVRHYDWPYAINGSELGPLLRGPGAPWPSLPPTMINRFPVLIALVQLAAGEIYDALVIGGGPAGILM